VVTVGIDIGGRSHAVARCLDGLPRADREVLRVSQSRAGFAALDTWLERQSERVAVVTMESSGHYWMPLASHLRRQDVPVAVVNPLAAKYLPRAGSPGRSPIRPMPEAWPRWECMTSPPLAIRSQERSCVKRPASR
jgi:transposase